MWKKIDLKEFLEKYSYDSDSKKIIEKSNDAKLKSVGTIKQRFKSETANKLNQGYKKCSFCSNEVLLKNHENHINQKCPKHPDKSQRIKKDKKGNLLTYYNTGKDIQICDLANQLNRSSTMILALFRSIGLEVSTEQDFVDKIFADSAVLLFNSRITTFDSSKNKSEAETLDSSENKKEKSLNPRKEIYKICPYCSANIKSEEHDLHIKEKCPKHFSKEIKQHQLEKQIKIAEKKECPLCLVSVNVNKFESHINERCPKNPKKSNISKLNLSVKKLPWTLLPQGEWLFIEIANHFKHLNATKKWRSKPFDENRLLKIEKSLRPNICFVGNDEFEGYIVYCFDWTNKVVLECPIYGNAIYIIKSGKTSWQEIAKATKWEARTKYSNQVKVINHSETWIERLEQNLRYGL